MFTRSILRLKQPVATVVGAFALVGVGACVARSIVVTTAFAESGERPKAFSGFFGLSLRLESAENLNHNTKLLRFKFSTPDTASGLTLTSSVLIMSWPKGKMFPTLRPYTPVSPLDVLKLVADKSGSLDLMVKRYPDGRGSMYLHSLVPGESLFFATVLKGYSWTPNKYSSVLLIAGGAGITPMYQLIQGILRNPEEKTKITLVFGVNGDADVLLKKEFDEFEQQFPGRLEAVYTVSHPVDGSHFRKGYITKALLEGINIGPQDKNTKVFVCGPPQMEVALLGAKGRFGQGGILEQLGYTKDQVYKF